MFNLSEPGETDYDLRLQLAGFPIRVHPLFWLMGGVFGALSCQDPVLLEYGIVPIYILIWVAVIFLSILVHELGHAFAMRYYGESARIVLYAMGGLAISGDRGFFSRTKSRTSLEQIIVSFAGPAAGFVLAGIVIGIIFAAGGDVTIRWLYKVIPFPEPSLIRGESMFETLESDQKAIYLFVILRALLYVNIFWGVLNLLPVFPLDGGQITRAVFNHYDPWQGIKRSLWLSLVVSAVIALLGFTNGRPFIGFMFIMLAVSSWQSIQQLDGRGGFGPRQW